MSKTSQRRAWLNRYQIDAQHGFLPVPDPLTKLPVAFKAWEDLCQQLPALLIAGRVRSAINDLPLLDAHLLTGKRQLERAMLLLSFAGHAYIYSNGQEKVMDHLPASLAQPWYHVAQALGRPPVMSYASYVLANWRRFQTHTPIALDNLACQTHFLGGMDEDWFILVHVVVEMEAGPGLFALVKAQEAVEQNDIPTVTTMLEQAAISLQRMHAALKRMPERCEPAIYYTRVRPYIFGWYGNPALPDGVVYEGVTAYEERPQKFRGETGAQSTVIPAFDTALGLQFGHDVLADHMQAMRAYMPPPHRNFIAFLQTQPSLRDFVLSHRDHHQLTSAYNFCIEQMKQFRETHLTYAGRYIHTQSQRTTSNPITTGTGGTPFMSYLKQHLHILDEHYIRKHPNVPSHYINQ